MNKHVIFIPHYKGSFKALLHIALHIKENNDVNPHFVLYFDDDSEAKRTLQDFQFIEIDSLHESR